MRRRATRIKGNEKARRNLAILPAAGFGDIRFGATRDAVREYFGEPSDIIKPRDEPGREMWVYPEARIVAGLQDGTLDAFEVFHPLATLNGRRIIGLSAELAVYLLREAFSFPIEAMIDDNGVAEQLRVRDLGFGAWLEDDIVTSVSWSDASGFEDQTFAQESPN